MSGSSGAGDERRRAAAEVVEVDGGAAFWVHASPGAKRSAVLGRHDGVLKVRVGAPPVDGKANAELLRFMAEVLGVAARDVELLAGHSSRRKRLRVRRPAVEVAAALGNAEANVGD